MNNKKNTPKSSRALIDLYEAMDDERKQGLSDFADFLYEKYGPVEKDIPAPDEIARPESETVVGAVKRLKLTYHMIDSMSVFSAASALMTDHMVKGRDVIEVIDEMQVLFEQAYEELIETGDGANNDDSNNSGTNDSGKK
jgi:hypothetical protein